VAMSFYPKSIVVAWSELKVGGDSSLGGAPEAVEGGCRLRHGSLADLLLSINVFAVGELVEFGF
jgi:hypothetical protein